MGNSRSARDWIVVDIGAGPVLVADRAVVRSEWCGKRYMDASTASQPVTGIDADDVEHFCALVLASQRSATKWTSRCSSVRIACPSCGGDGFGAQIEAGEACATCSATGSLTITRYRPATRAEVEAAQRKHDGPEWVEGGLVLAGEVAR